jgi:hypothetical protein
MQPTQLLHPVQPRHQAQPAQATDNAVIAQPATAALSTVPALPAVPTEAIVIALPADATLHAVAALPTVNTLPRVPTATAVTRLSLVATDAAVSRLERVSRLKRGALSSVGSRGRFTVRIIADSAGRYHPWVRRLAHSCVSLSVLTIPPVAAPRRALWQSSRSGCTSKRQIRDRASSAPGIPTHGAGSSRPSGRPRAAAARAPSG